MQKLHFHWNFIWSVLFVVQANAFEHVVLSHDGPAVLGGTITFRADLYNQQTNTVVYHWSDDAFPPHTYKTEKTSNTTTFWSITYPREKYNAGSYEVEVIVKSSFPFFLPFSTSDRIKFYITEQFNGNITISQSNKTLEDSYVSSKAETNMTISMRNGDMDLIKEKATMVLTSWFIDCKYHGQTTDLTFSYNFTNPNVSHIIEALVIASYELPETTTVTIPSTIMPSSTTAMSSVENAENVTAGTVLNTTLSTITTTPSVKTTEVTVAPVTLKPVVNITMPNMGNVSLPYICSNSSIIPPDPKKTYGLFSRRINVREPIMNITIEGTNWIQPWDMLSLNVTCKGSGPFYKCLQFHRGKYNMTGNETCDNGDHIHFCNFSIIHYFLEPSVYTILVILNNDISKQIYPLTINIYKVTTKPQLSVIVVPVSCSLAAVVLIVFGVAYYIQSRARFTIEVADFDFGQSNPEMEYKTFSERLRDSFNNAIRPGSKRISGYKPLSNPQTLQ